MTNLLVLASVACIGIAFAQTDPTVYSDDDGNLKFEIAEGNALTADSAFGGKPTAVQILAKIEDMKTRLKALKAKGSNQEEVEKALKVRTVTETWDGSDGHSIKLGLFAKSQAVNLDVSHSGCGIHSAFSYTLAAFANDDLNLEAFQKGHAQGEYMTDKFSLYASPAQQDNGLYWLWLQVDSTCGSTTNADDHSHKTVVKAQVGVQSGGGGLIDADAIDAKQGSPKSNDAALQVISLEQTFEGASNIRGTSIDFDVPYTATDIPMYDFGGELIDMKPAKKYEATYMSLGLASASSVLNVEVDLVGCGTATSVSFNVVGSTGAQNDMYDRRLTAYTFATGGRPAPKWIKGGSIGEANLATLLYEPNPSNDRQEFYLWLKIDGTVLGGGGCQGDQQIVRVHAKVASAAGVAMSDFDAARKQPRKFGEIPTVSFEVLADKAAKLQPEPVVMTWTESKGVLSTPKPLYLGVFKLSQSIDVKIESQLPCSTRNGYHFHLSPSGQPGWDRELMRATNYIVAYEFGSAVRGYEDDRVAMKYIKVGGQVHIWMTHVPRVGKCENDQENTLTVWASIDSAGSELPNPIEPFNDAPPAMEDSEEYPLEDVEIVSLTDTLATLSTQEDLRAAAALAVGQVIYSSDWLGIMDAPLGNPEEREQFTKYIGTFSAEEVVHIDATDRGCGTNVGIYANVVSRHGIGTDHHRDGPIEPESFIMGTAVPEANRNAIQLYWRPTPNPKSATDADKNYYDLYVGVTERPCEVPKEYQERPDIDQQADPEGAKKWWQESWLNGENPPHTLEVTVKRSGVTPGNKQNQNFRCAKGEAYIMQAEGFPFACGTPQELKLKPDGSVQSPGEFKTMSRISAEDIASSAVSAPQKFGDIKDWDATLKRPVFGPLASETTVLPYEMTLTEWVTAHGITRNMHYQYIEDENGIEDKSGLMYTPTKCTNCDPKTGYMYLGTFQAEQVITVDFSDVQPWAFGQSIVCSGKPFFGKATAIAVTWKAPKCFTYGTGAFREDTMKIVYRADTTDKNKRRVDYWLSSAIKPGNLGGRFLRRDYNIMVKAMKTYDDFKNSARRESWRFGAYSKDDQAAMLVKLNAALDTSSATETENKGQVEFISMEDTAGYSGFPLPRE